jgi:hypothetical protein
MDFAPIVLFVYNRPWHTRQTLEALSMNELAKESDLFIFSDGPRENATCEDLKMIDEVRSIALEKKWCKNSKLIASDRNKGIETSTIEGVTRVVNEFGKVIVLEDDLITAPYFLRYMNDGLEVYSDNKNVYSVNGYMFPIQGERLDSVLLPFTSSWGWGTWKDRWEKFEQEISQKECLLNNHLLASRFNMGDYKYTDILPLNTWDIRWYYSVFLRNGLGLFPTLSLVKNIGFDGSGTHYTQKLEVTQYLTLSRIQIKEHDKFDLSFLSNYLSFFQKDKKSVSARIIGRIKKKLKKIGWIK